MAVTIPSGPTLQSCAEILIFWMIGKSAAGGERPLTAFAFRRQNPLRHGGATM
jgi:hypothetical protein